MSPPPHPASTLPRVTFRSRRAGLDAFDVTDTSHKNKRHYTAAIPDAVRERLEAFYAPHNAALRELFPDAGLDF